jgi:medium-chain acyl-[acyl-carrier-protein] hydrolase
MAAMELMQYEKEYRVHVYETGPDGRLNLYSLFNYLQDIASDHAIRLGFGRDDLLRENRIWVLSRIYAEIAEWPQWEDTIVVKTWPNGIDRLFALRNFDVSFPDGRHIASATSSWLILDMTTRKVQRPDSILAKFYPDLNPNQSPIRYASKLEASGKESNSSRLYRISVSDLDLNLHTNNVRYLTWVSDCYKLDFVMENVPRSAEINYLAESQFGEEVLITTEEEKVNGPGFCHSIFRTSDNRELCRLRIEWNEINNK